jgi:hypothetical protein
MIDSAGVDRRTAICPENAYEEWALLDSNQ